MPAWLNDVGDFFKIGAVGVVSVLHSVEDEVKTDVTSTIKYAVSSVGSAGNRVLNTVDHTVDQAGGVLNNGVNAAKGVVTGVTSSLSMPLLLIGGGLAVAFVVTSMHSEGIASTIQRR
jgi:phage-related protein